MTIHIHVGANMPGYLPEGDIMCFDDVASALDALRHEIKDQQDFYYEGCDGSCGNQECDCAWCAAAADCEAAVSAIRDGDTAHVLTNQCAAELRTLEESGHSQPVGTGWIFSPPEGADIHHWLSLIPTDRDSCEIAEDQGE